MLQFVGESVATVAVAAAIGVALTEWLLPFVNAFLDTNALLAWNDPLLLAVLFSLLVLLALAVGFWPAVILSGFRPAFVLRGPTSGRSRSRAAQAPATRGAPALGRSPPPRARGCRRLRHSLGRGRPVAPAPLAL